MPGLRLLSFIRSLLIPYFLFFSIPLLLLFFGEIIFVPPADISSSWGGLRVTLFFVWLIMAVYGLVLAYGLFVQPKHLRNLLTTFSKWRIFGKSRAKIKKAAEDIIPSSLDIKSRPFMFHAKTTLATIVGWVCRFFSITAILIALNPAMQQSFYDHCILFGRGEALYAVTAYSPTPGGSGVAELIFWSVLYGIYISGLGCSGCYLMETYYLLPLFNNRCNYYSYMDSKTNYPS